MSEMNKVFPDTLMLEERAGLAMNAIIGVSDKDHEYIPYFNGTLAKKPAFLTHGDYDYGSSHGRLIDAVILARKMSGETFGEDIEEKYKENLLSFFREDGMNYRKHLPRKDWEGKYANMIDQRSVILSLTTWYMSTEDPKVKEAAEKHVAALKRIAVKEKDIWYYPSSEYSVEGWPSPNSAHLRLAPDPASFSGRLIMPLLKFHQLTGNQDAYELCQFFSALIVDRSGIFNKDGSFNDAMAYRSGHFHTRLGTLEGLARFGMHTRDASLINFVKRSFDWALTKCTAFGWTPGDLQEQAYEHETCSLVDLIATGAVLARSGYTEYWGVIERFLRNQLTETQLINLDWVEDLETTEKDVPGKTTYYNVADRVKGAFAGYSAPNDFSCDINHGRGHTSDLQTCCIGSGTRGLFIGWSNIITEEEDRVSVNLLLNRGSNLLDVKSYLPHEGRVDLIINQDIKNLQIRIPEWAGYHKVEIKRLENEETTTQSGKDASMWVKKHFLFLGSAKKGEEITITFPLHTYKTTETAIGQEFLTTWRGDDVVHISPEGAHHPLYNGRKVYDEAPLRTGSLYRPEKNWTW